VSALASSTALARHTDKEHITDQTAYTMQQNEWRLGLFRVEYGIWDSVSVGTYTLPWILTIFSGMGKWRFYDSSSGDFSASTRLSTLVFDLGSFQERFGDKPAEDDPSATLVVIPFELATSYKLNTNMTLSAEMVFTSVKLEGEGGSDDGVKGAAATSNGQLGLTFEWRWTDVTAFVLHFRTLMYQTAQASAGTTVILDEYTTLEIVGSGETDALDYKASSIVPSLHWSWDSFNLRAGLGYGNWNIPGVNFVVPTKSTIVDFDLFWRF
jgi:hypothetical protein